MEIVELFGVATLFSLLGFGARAFIYEYKMVRHNK
jgi:hypothetical protein